jgi:hypothetical protein
MAIIFVCSSFERDMRKEGWSLVADVGSKKRRFCGWDFARPTELDTSEIALVKFVSGDDPASDCGEGHLHPYTSSLSMLKRARGEEPVGGRILRNCNWGQRHGEALVRNLEVIPERFWPKMIILPGTVWKGRYDLRQQGLKEFRTLLVPALFSPGTKTCSLGFVPLSWPASNRMRGDFSDMCSFICLKEIPSTPVP